MRSAWIGQLVAESLGEGIDSRKEIDLWLLHHPLLRWKADREKDSSRKNKEGYILYINSFTEFLGPLRVVVT